MRRTRAADPKNKKGDKRERGEEGGEGRREREEKKKGRGLFWAWLMGVFSTVCDFGQKKIPAPR